MGGEKSLSSSSAKPNLEPNVGSKLEFVRRESLLTTISKTPGGRVLYAWSLSTVAIVFLAEIVRYAFDQEVLWQDIALIVRIFNPLPIFILTWIAMHFPIFAILYPSVQLRTFTSRSNLFVPSVIGTLLLIAIIPLAVAIRYHKMTEMVRFMVALEQIRLVMKVVAYSVEVSKVDTNVHGHSNGTGLSNGLAEVKDEKKSKDESTSLYALIYFLFAPTLVFRSSYPSLGRAKSYQNVFKFGMEIASLAFIGFIFYRRQYEPIMMQIGSFPLSQLTVHQVLSIIKYSMIVGGICLAGIGFGFLHSWLNIWAELLDFGDRQFYKSWWECRGIDEFMRTWNYLIHSWISAYLYKPTMMLTNSKTIGLLVVILTSAFIHDYAMSFSALFPTSIFTAVVIFVMIPTFAFASIAHYLQGDGVNFFTFFVLSHTALVIGFMGGSEYATRVYNCININRSPYSIMLGIFDCEF